MTILLSVLGMLIGVVMGVILSVMLTSPNPVLKYASLLYIWLFRGTPLLVQVLFWGNFGVLFQHLVLGIPYTHIWLFSVSVNSVITIFVASVLALGLAEASFMAEIVRAGILLVDEGQIHASMALGLSKRLTMRRIILPQAVRVIIPPTGNEFINMLKGSSMVVVIAGNELLTRAENIISETLRTIELLMVATTWYLVLTTVATIGQHFLERRFARGTSRSLPETVPYTGRWLRRGRTLNVGQVKAE